MKHHALGLDFGTSSCRALIVDARDGREIGVGVVPFAHGEDGVIVDRDDPDLARQVPDDWRSAAVGSIRQALADAARHGVRAEHVAGIGVDATASTPLPVDARLRPLADDARHRDDRAALGWLWKDHTAQREAAEISALLAEHAPLALSRCGGSYSSEWFWAKALRCARVAPQVFAATHLFVELSDWVPAWLCGIGDPNRLAHNACAAGHKALFVPELGGYPAAALLDRLQPGFGALASRMPSRVVHIENRIGGLDTAVASACGLVAGTAVAAGAIDAHLGAVGSGIQEGDLVKVLGTSACDMAVVRSREAPRAEGLSGVARDTILPGAFGVEAGQAAFGDAFAWCAREVGGRDLAALERDAASLRPGESGLLALEWLNGNRSVLADPALSGTIVGLNLHTRAHEVWRAMVEAAAFGARMIVERMVRNGVPIRRSIVCGGIAHKSELVVQILADVLGCEVAVAASAQTCALGAAIAGAVAGGLHRDVHTAQAAMCRAPVRVFRPDPAAVAVYERLFRSYRLLHDAFGGVATVELATVMKDLIGLRAQVRGAGDRCGS
ncbi:MAG: ribulokinase [Planctomycetota bacterium]